jgi:hypothetical protein
MVGKSAGSASLPNDLRSNGTPPMKLKPHRLAKQVRFMPKNPTAPASDSKPLSEKEFNRRRRMWVVVGGDLRFAPADTPMFHREWFAADGIMQRDDDATYEKLVRGFVDHRGIFAYRGRDFSGMGCIAQLTRPVLERMKEELGLDPETEIWIGLRHCPNEVWKGEIVWSTLALELED